MQILKGIGLGGYRSFGTQLQRIGPLDSINLFIGQNNAGKSNILLFLEQKLAATTRSIKENAKASFLGDLDIHRGADRAPFRFAYSFSRSDSMQGLSRHFGKRLEQTRVNFDSILNLPHIFQKEAGTCWLEYCMDLEGKLSVTEDLIAAITEDDSIPLHVWQTLYAKMNNQNTQSKHECVSFALNTIGSTLSSMPSPAAKLIPAIRKITADEGTDLDFGGRGLIHQLARLRDPDVENLQDAKKFEQINDFAREVLGNSSVELTIPFSRKTLHSRIDGKTLPLESLGTGVHETIILAAAATLLDKQIVCMEEPELHLHPMLQRRLIRYLASKTTNQYFIASHSSHILDAPETTVFHVQMADGETEVRLAETAAEKADIARDLGYRSSDLMQTNCIIWVEGPSDRIYLLHWLKLIANDLIEGLHFSIMFYGGRLLAHLAVDDVEVSEFISLRRLNRQAAIIIDSDKKKARDSLNATKRRVIDAFDRSSEPGFAWVTYGREIENYIPDEVLLNSIKKNHPRCRKTTGCGRFDRCTEYSTSTGKSFKADKVKLARTVTACDQNLEMYDLEKRMRQLESFIRESNR